MRSRNYVALAIAILLLTRADVVRAQPTLPDFSAAVFDHSLQIDNPYFPLVLGTTFTYDGLATDPESGETESEIIVVEVLDQARSVAGIDARVVRDRVWLEGLLIEDTFDWYAQDNAGNVWYLGEDVTDYEYDDSGNLIGTSHPGAWETGVDGALPGHIMKSAPLLGDYYYQEFYPTEAEDNALVIGVGESHNVPSGSYNRVLHTRDFSLDLSTYGDKFFAPGVGTILEHDIDATTGMVLGVTTLRSITVVPEPCSIVTVALCSVPLLLWRRRS